jgi:SP family facilitated glucose transporter-like MFS transporter 8
MKTGETIERPSVGRAVVAILIVLLAPLLFGIIVGSTGPSIDTMKNEVRDKNNNIVRLNNDSEFVVFTEGEADIYSSLVTVGAMVGAIVSGYMVNAIGYKKSLLCTVPLYIVCFIAMYLTSSAYVLFAARTVTGLAVGINSFIVPTYIADVAPVSYRGLFGAANQLCITLGIFLVYFLGMIFRVDGGQVYSDSLGVELNLLSGENLTINVIAQAPDGMFCNWRMLSVLNTIPAVILGIGVIFIPEAPSWLTLKQNEDCVGDKCDIKAAPNTSTWSLLKLSWRQLLIALALQFFQQFSGINAVMFFCTSILRDARLPKADSIAASVMFEQVLVTGAAVALMDLAGRKVLLLIGASTMAAACGILGLYFYLVSLQETVSILFVIIGMYVYIAAFSIGVGAIPWLILGEIFPANTKAAGASVATMANWTFAFLVTLTFRPADRLITTQGVMWFFGACCIGLVVFTALAVPETKGKSFDEIQEYFNGKEISQGDSQDAMPNPKGPEETEKDPLISNNRKRHTSFV